MHKKLVFTITIIFVLANLQNVTSVCASNELWSQTYGTKEGDYAFDVIQTSDGGYVLVGITRDDYGVDIDCFMVKTDANGNMEWNQTYDRDDSDHANSLVETSDGGFAIAGHSGSSMAGRPREIWLVKTDNQGNVEWNRTYGEGRAYSLIVPSDGGFVIAGSTRLVKTDVYGNMFWNKTYPSNVLSVVETPDGGYALAGYARNVPSYANNTPILPNPPDERYHMDYSLVKTDADGNVEWSKLYAHIDLEWINMTGEINDYAYDLVVTPDGGYAIAGVTTSYPPIIFGGPHYFWVVKTDEYGNMSWNCTYGIEDGISGSARAIVLTRDGDFAIAGGEFLIKVDSQGEIIWKQNYDNCYAYSLIQTSDNGFALAGSSGTLDAVGKTDFWLAKTDEYGIPEFPSWTVLPFLLTASVASIICKQKLVKRRERG